jgi:hypothetical protein
MHFLLTWQLQCKTVIRRRFLRRHVLSNRHTFANVRRTNFSQLFNFDQLTKLDKWKTTLLLRVKNTIEEGGEDFS